jgi:class 3 adenylate cyclase/predicted ATPase
MLDIARWLAEQGLGHHAEVFAENGIAGDVLRDLTDADLKELGLNLGDRKRLLKAIAALPAAVPAQDQAEAVGRTAPRMVARDAERRQLTVLFCDLVGSTELSARLDPEDLRAIMGAYQAACAEVTGRFGGHVAKFLGDGVLVYFGWPRAHEDDAERAVRAGLGLLEAVAGLEARPDAHLQARVGIATGQVVVGDLISQGAADPDSVTGDAPNVAARLQALAPRGTVVIAEATRRLIAGLFELYDLGPQRLKGFDEPLAVWQVTAERRAEGRFEARQTTRLSPLIGRDEELSLLLSRWRQAADGDGQVVLLSGEPGIGKSRLVRELGERLQGEPHLRLLYQCSPHHTTSPLHPVIEQLERAAGFERHDSQSDKLEKLEALLAHGTQKLNRTVPLVAALLSIPANDRYPLPELTPQRQKELTLEALVDQLDRLSAAQPVLLIYEDVHWIDPTTQELLGLTIERVQHLQVLALITCRPEFTPPWPSQAHVSALALTRLGRREGAALVDGVVGAKSLPHEVSAQIVAKTDGVPLFVEELTKTVLESGLLQDAGDRYELSGPLPPLAIPTSLHDSLLARLDRLAPVKEVAQTAAVIGREFSHELLAAVSPLPEPQLNGALDRLVAAELVYRRGAPPDVTYSFKHALVQDTAYGTLLRSKRQQLHARIAKVLEQQFPETAETQPELLAQHCTEAGLTEKGIRYWVEAGQRAIGRSAMAEAVAQLQRGLGLVPKLPAGSESSRWELDLQVALGAALLALKGGAAPEMGEAYERALELCRETGTENLRATALFGIWQDRLNRAELSVAWELVDELLRTGKRCGDRKVEVAGHRCALCTKLFSAEFTSALDHFDQLMVLHVPGRRYSGELLLDPWVSGHSLVSWVLLLLGHPERALTHSREALNGAHKQLRPYMLAATMHQQNVVDQLRGNRRTVEERATGLMKLTKEQGFAHWHATATFLHGWALAAAGAVAAGVDEMRRGLAAKQATGAQLKVPYYLGLMAGVLRGAGSGSDALTLLEEALARVNRTGERWFEAELHRLKGEAALAYSSGRAVEAETCFRQAVAVAQNQSARLWELRAATSLARLWRDQGKRAQAHDLLAPVYGRFTEGFDTADLQNAKGLLDELP